MITTSSARLKSAIRRYNNGERPYRFTQPRAWYLVGPKDRAYPLKYIFALAIDKKPGSFNTSDAISEAQRLGFRIKREPKNQELEFQKRVSESLKSPKARALRLARAPKFPRRVVREVVTYDRNPDVVAEVLSRAKGRCESCGKPAPFRKRIDRSLYLEVHHKIQLAHGGEDTVKNAIALCPNCHRREHHG